MAYAISEKVVCTHPIHFRRHCGYLVYGEITDSLNPVLSPVQSWWPLLPSRSTTAGCIREICRWCRFGGCGSCLLYGKALTIIVVLSISQNDRRGQGVLLRRHTWWNPKERSIECNCGSDISKACRALALILEKMLVTKIALFQHRGCSTI